MGPIKMWFSLFKLVLFIYLTTFTSVAAYYRDNYKWRGTNNVNQFKSAVVTTERPRLRHSNYDRVLQRLENMQDSITRKPYRSRAKYSATTTTATTTAESALFEEYDEDDEVYDDDVEDAGSWKSGGEPIQKKEQLEQNDEDDYEDDDPDVNDEYVEEETEKPERSTNRPVSSLTAYKWEHFGTPHRVEETRRNTLRIQKGNDAVWAAVQHSVLMSNVAKCRTPSPKVIPVQSIHPDSTKEYTPHCTILHRCADDTGCCSNDAMKCAPKKQTQIHLFVYARTLGVRGVKVERLPFYNHTECACLHKSKITDALTEELSSDDVNSSSGISVRSAETSLTASYLRRCKCPKLYSPRLESDMSCACDCSDLDPNCLMMKKGIEHFSLIDRKCILDKHCAIPKCLYGNYLKDMGKCPVAKERRNSRNSAYDDIFGSV